MIVLRAVGAAFADRRAGLVGPFEFALAAGDRYRIDVTSPRAASIAARMFAAIVKPTTGNVYVCEYDTRLQPPQAKRRLGFIDAGGFQGNAHAFACEVAFRSDVWGMDHAVARRRARAMLAALTDFEEVYARAAALALLSDVELVVLDQPQARLADALSVILPRLAIIETDVARGAVLPVARPTPA